MPSTGFTLVGTGTNNADAGAQAWANPGNITASDDTRAIASSMFGTTTSQYLHGTNAALTGIPSGATIDGIETRAERHKTSTPTITDHTIQLIVGGSRTGDNKASGSAWPLTTDATADYGGAADLWGLTPTRAEVVASNFGFAVRSQSSGGSSGQNRVDAMWINVHYTEGGTTYNQAVDGSAGATATMARQTGKIVTASGANAATLAKLIGTTLSASSVGSAALTALKVILLVLSATAGSGATLARQAGKVLGATSSGSATATRQTSKGLAASATGSAAIAAIKVILLTLSASAGSVASRALQIGKGLVATVLGSATVAKLVGLSRSATAGSTASVAKSIAKTLAASAGSLVDLVVQLVQAALSRPARYTVSVSAVTTYAVSTGAATTYATSVTDAV